MRRHKPKYPKYFKAHFGWWHVNRRMFLSRLPSLFADALEREAAGPTVRIASQRIIDIERKIEIVKNLATPGFQYERLVAVATDDPEVVTDENHRAMLALNE